MNRLLLLLTLLLIPSLRAEPVIYTYETSDGGGIARLEADPDTGAVRSHEVLFSDPALTHIKKVTVSADGAYIAANRDEVEDQNNLVVVNMRGEARFYSFKDEVDPLAFHENLLYVGTTDGKLHRLDPANGKITASWDFRKQLEPSGRRPESFFFDRTKRVLWISFQKDSKKRKHFGSRIVGIDLERDKLIADLRLPRDKPELHYSPSVDGRESGPNPEVLFVDPDSDTLFVTLDLYGAVAMMDLDAARKGKLKNYRVESTAADGSFGTAFPDRVGVMRHGGRAHLLVANSGPAGGVAVVDLHGRRVAKHLDTPHGLDSLYHLPRAGRVVAGSSGKRKTRGPEGLDKHNRPLSTWIQFKGGPANLEVVRRPMQAPIHLLAPVDAAKSPLVYLSYGDNGDVWRIQHPAEKTPRAEIPAFGEIRRLSTTRSR